MRRPVIRPKGIPISSYTPRYNHFETVNLQIVNCKQVDKELLFSCTTRDGDWRDALEASLSEFMPDGALTKGIIVFDASRGCDVVVVCSVFCAICDNPRSSQVASHVSQSGKLFCRLCMISKDILDVDLNPNESLLHVHNTHFELRTIEKTRMTLGRIANATTKAAKTRIRIETGVAYIDLPHPCVDLEYFDYHAGTPLEILHLLLLWVFYLKH
jgi:hypothetical protein